MSHVVQVKLEVTNLGALARAAEQLGCELVKGQQTYRWYSTYVGDSPLPEGFTPDELGKCEHAIRVKGADKHTYEVGVVRSKNGKGYVLLWDEWAGGYGLVAKIGNGAAKLRQGYAVQVARETLRANGYEVQQVRRTDGTIVLRARN